MIKRKFFLTIALIVFLFSAFASANAQTVKVSTEEEITADINAVACKNSERLAAVKALFLKAGAKEDEIKIEKIKDVENLTIVKKGKTDEKVVVGAHYDKSSEGCGAIDNWTGIVILANLYRTLKDLTTEKTYVFTAFGKEELGLYGSDAAAGAIPKDKRIEYCAMVNFDSFGFAYPQAMRNISDDKLIDLAEEVSKEFKFPFGDAAITNASSDSESFRIRKIPAISFHGLSDRWREYLHTARDKTSNINMSSVYVAYRYGLVYLAKIDAKGCGDFR